MAPAALGTWNFAASTMENPALQTVLRRDERQGWTQILRLRPSARVVGDGEDTWLNLPIKKSFNLLAPNGTGGNIVFAVSKTTTKTPPIYADPPDGCASS